MIQDFIRQKIQEFEEEYRDIDGDFGWKTKSYYEHVESFLRTSLTELAEQVRKETIENCKEEIQRSIHWTVKKQGAWNGVEVYDKIEIDNTLASLTAKKSESMNEVKEKEK